MCFLSLGFSNSCICTGFSGTTLTANCYTDSGALESNSVNLGMSPGQLHSRMI